MMKIDKRVVINITRDSVTERLADYLDNLKHKYRGAETEQIRNWIIASYQMQELGGGVVDAWLSVERNGELDGLTRAEKSQVLISMLERISGTQTEPAIPEKIKSEDKTEKKQEPPSAGIPDLVQDYST